MKKIILIGENLEALEEIASRLCLEYDVPVVLIECGEQAEIDLPVEFIDMDFAGTNVVFLEGIIPFLPLEDLSSETGLEESALKKSPMPSLIDSIEYIKRQDKLDIPHFDLTKHPIRIEKGVIDNLPCPKIPGCLRLMNANIGIEEDEDSSEEDEEEDKK